MDSFLFFLRTITECVSQTKLAEHADELICVLLGFQTFKFTLQGQGMFFAGGQKVANEGRTPGPSRRQRERYKEETLFLSLFLSCRPNLFTFWKFMRCTYKFGSAARGLHTFPTAADATECIYMCVCMYITLLTMSRDMTNWDDMAAHIDPEASIASGHFQSVDCVSVCKYMRVVVGFSRVSNLLQKLPWFIFYISSFCKFQSEIKFDIAVNWKKNTFKCLTLKSFLVPMSQKR